MKTDMDSISVKSLKSQTDYKNCLKSVKSKIQKAQLSITLAANQQVTQFYWELGAYIVGQQAKRNWGDKFIEALADDLQQSFPGSKGFSRSNLHNMKRFAQTYSLQEIVQALPGQLPWSHNVVLIQRVKDSLERSWYADQVIRHGWSYRQLIDEIKNELYKRQGVTNTKTSNFDLRLPAQQSQLANGNYSPTSCSNLPSSAI